jgi:hypothetical protein
VGRRAVLVLALVIVGAVAALGVAMGGLPRTDPARPAQASTPTPPPREPRQVFTLSVDLTRSGVVWLTTAGADCGGCVVVWRRTPDDPAWVPLRQVGSDHRPGQIRMSDSGADGLIGGAGLWVTHDGGDSWNAEPGVPVAPDAQVQAEVAGAHAWALVRRPEAMPVLWRNSLDGAAWREVGLPAPLDPDAAPIAVGAALLLWVVGGSGPEAVVTRDAGRTWQPLDPPCARGGGQVGTAPAYTTCLSRKGLEAAVLEGGRWATWPLSTALGPAASLSPVSAASSFATAPDGTGYVVVRGGLLASRDRGRTWDAVE